MEFREFHHEDLSDLRFLITGGGGFIGSHLAEYLVRYNAAKVRVFDNFSTGFERNLKSIQDKPSFELLEGDVRDPDLCRDACKDIDVVFHQAAMGSVPKSVEDPLTFHDVNVSGFLNVISAALQEGVERFVYASSSSVYGDHPSVSKQEDQTGRLLSPYAVTKYSNELYADVFYQNYGFSNIGLRYFNVFGPRQNPDGDYAAVIPKFILRLMQGQAPAINGDGKQTRDFTFVSNIVQANIEAFEIQKNEKVNNIFNVGCGNKTDLIDLIKIMEDIFNVNIDPEYFPPRAVDIRESLADIAKAREVLGYNPDVDIKEGLESTIDWFKKYYS